MPPPDPASGNVTVPIEVLMILIEVAEDLGELDQAETHAIRLARRLVNQALHLRATS